MRARDLNQRLKGRLPIQGAERRRE